MVFNFCTIFCIFYTLFPEVLAINGTVPLKTYTFEYINHFFGSNIEFGNFISMLLFSLSTMVSFGFGNINISIQSEHNILGMFIITINLITGYFLLAVIVTRLSILFQTMGQGYTVNKNDKWSRPILVDSINELHLHRNARCIYNDTNIQDNDG